MTALQLARIE